MTPRDQIAILRCLQQRAELFEDIARLEAELHTLLGDAARALALVPPEELPSRRKGKRTIHALPNAPTGTAKRAKLPQTEAPSLQEPFAKQSGNAPCTIHWTYQGQSGTSQHIDAELIRMLLQLPRDVLAIHVDD